MISLKNKEENYIIIILQLCGFLHYIQSMFLSALPLPNWRQNENYEPDKYKSVFITLCCKTPLDLNICVRVWQNGT